jgi:hypothetical protein
MTGDELMAFLDELSAAERKTFDEMRAALKQPVRARALPWYRAFGQGVLALRGAEDAADRYGWMSRLARALGCSLPVLHKTRSFARRYTTSEVKSLARKGITWGLVYATFPVEDKEEQIAWMHRAKEEHWTGHDLEREIQKAKQGPQRKGGAPRRALKCYGPAVDLRNLVRVSEEWLRHHHEVWTAENAGLLDQLAAMPPADYSDTLPHQLEGAERALEELAQAASALNGQLQALRKRVKRALDTKR